MSWVKITDRMGEVSYDSRIEDEKDRENDLREYHLRLKSQPYPMGTSGHKEAQKQILTDLGYPNLLSLFGL